MACCNTCLYDEVGCLRDGDDLTLNIAGLVNGEDYIAEVSIPGGTTYQVPFSFDGTTNQVELPVGSGDNEIPPSVFNKHIGEIEITIKDAETHECVDFQMLVATRCLTLNVNGSTGAYAKDVVGIDIPSV